MPRSRAKCKETGLATGVARVEMKVVTGASNLSQEALTALLVVILAACSGRIAGVVIGDKAFLVDGKDIVIACMHTWCA